MTFDRRFGRSRSYDGLMRSSSSGASFEWRHRDVVSRSFRPVHSLIRSASHDNLRRQTPEVELGSMWSRTGRAVSPFRSHVSSQFEDQPMRKYDVYSIRTWSYPIWKYMNTPGGQYRSFSLQTSYTPPLMSSDCAARRRAYSGYSYMAAEPSYRLVGSTPALGSRYGTWRPSRSPWYYNYYGCGAMRHFGGFRPRNSHFLNRPLWLR